MQHVNHSEIGAPALLHKLILTHIYNDIACNNARKWGFRCYIHAFILMPLNLRGAGINHTYIYDISNWTILAKSVRCITNKMRDLEKFLPANKGKSRWCHNVTGACKTGLQKTCSLLWLTSSSKLRFASLPIWQLFMPTIQFSKT